MHQRLITHNSDCLYISLTEINEDFKTNIHSHPNIELLLIIKGSGYIKTNNRNILVKEKDIIIINPNSKHYEETIGLKFYAIGLSKINIYLKESFNKKIIHESLKQNDYEVMLSLYEIIYKEANLNLEYSSDIISNSVSSIIKLIERNKDIIINDSKDSKDSDLVTNIKNIIDNNYFQTIKLDEIAYRLSESKSNICHQFKKETGMGIIEYKLNKQLEEAKNLLNISDMNIIEISNMVGFSSASMFSKYFKNKYNHTPKEERELQNGILIRDFKKLITKM